MIIFRNLMDRPLYFLSDRFPTNILFFKTFRLAILDLIPVFFPPQPIPVISVVQSSEKTSSAEREANIPFAPGPFQNHSLSWDKNAIPRYSSQFSKFHIRLDTILVLQFVLF